MSVQQQLDLWTSNRLPVKHDAGGILFDLTPNSDVLVVSCSGVVPDNTIIYAMENTTSSLVSNKIYICDRHSLWYYGGLEGISSSFDETVAVLRSAVEAINPRRTYAIGTSGGGYMAMAITALLGLDRALAMAPQTIISRSGRAALDDRRWTSSMETISTIASPYDIRQLAPSSNKSTYHVIYPCNEQLDAVHAERLRDLENVELYPVETADHNVSAYMKHHNLLRPCIDAFIASDRKDVSRNIRNCLLTNDRSTPSED